MRKILLVCLSIFLAACATQPTKEEALNADYGAMPTTADFVSTVESEIRRRMKDPDSAKFQYPFHAQKGWYQPPFGKRYFGWWTCGLVNAKNSFGGYTGFGYFLAVYNGGRVVYVNLEEKGESVDWTRAACTNRDSADVLSAEDQFTVGLSAEYLATN